MTQHLLDTAATEHDVRGLLSIAEKVVQEAGALAAAMRAAGISVASTKSSQLDIVTQADTAVENLIRQRLREARPDDGFFGEETGNDDQGTSGITWIVDPIDGTVNYLYGSPYYSVSIAATVTNPTGGQVSVAGSVHAPALGQTYTATAGGTPGVNGEEIRANLNAPLDKALVATGMMYDLAKRARVLQDVTNLTAKVRDFRFGGSAALDICGVAEGRTDAYVHRNLPIWDYAAATLIAGQAGAHIHGLGDGAASSDLLIVGSEQLVEDLLPELS